MFALASLFAIAYLAATILPFSSELVLAGLLAEGSHAPLLLFLAASLGNILGSVTNYGLGRLCLHWQHHRWFPVSEDALGKAQTWFQRYGQWSLLLAWVPVIGDPLTLAAGVLKVRFSLFLLLVSLSKMSRYAVIIGLFEQI
ncbi:YqaA family protein [Coralliovum pocilloporae]|uniref:YqaA family protein n=1 Tax=Coralliovum pocilloporae TaxID=3066369 RepID=UPI0033073BA9